ncbi:spore germination protein GerPE [Bacillus lacus]|uniref:Spore germination protein GerPE n=1 Tax=Metabacillus lacus TaxID=1983721 RepID=A0A7X2M101_9BACI|nr:spore germination protein GerPE [Metabacillus lacus]MRX73519.1 spore germination protein GerPE [Metabacillus lacus]
MLKRTSVVQTAYLNSAGLSSVFQIGDALRIHNKTNVFAVQREQEIFYINEGNLQEYAIFKEEIPLPLIDENITINVYHDKPFIQVKAVKVTAISSSAVFQIGSVNEMYLESRVKHTRQLRFRNSQNTPG